MTDSSTDYNKALFLNLVMMLSSSAMQQMGKLMNPVTGKTEVNLDGAQASIDLLEMLKAKTRNNLDKEEERALSDIISTVQMNYVDVANAPSTPIDEKKPDEPAAPAEPAGDKTATDTPPPDGKEPKFRKKYD